MGKQHILKKRKKLLFLSQCFPLPLDGGGRIKTFNTISCLSKKFDIYAIFVSERLAKKEHLKLFKKMDIKVKIFQTNMIEESIKKNYPKLIWNYLQLRPHFVYQYRNKQAIEFIKKAIVNWRPDIIHVDHINSSQFLPNKYWLILKLKKKPICVLENHNINHLLFKTRLKETRKIIRKAYFLIEGWLNLLYGLVNYPRYDHIFSISDEETKYLKKFYSSVTTQPLVYPIQRSRNLYNKVYDILFVGYLDWPPNEVAVKWFTSKILPLINQQRPNIKFHIVGKLNTKLLYLKNNHNIVFHGYQKKLDTYLGASKIFVLPFRTGSGVRIKSLTALQNGIPIVSTKLGVEGLKIKNRKEYLLAETERAFAKATITLLENKRLRNKISIAQKEYFERNHTVAENEKYLNKYIQICANR